MPAVIAPIVLLRMGYQSSKYYMMTAETFDTQKALKTGLIDQISNSSSSIDDAISVAESLLNNNQMAMQSTKKWLQTLRPVTKAQMDLAAEQLAKIRSIHLMTS